MSQHALRRYIEAGELRLGASMTLLTLLGPQRTRTFSSSPRVGTLLPRPIKRSTGFDLAFLCVASPLDLSPAPQR